MQSKQQFTEKHGITDKTFYNWVDKGKVIARKIPGDNKTYVIPIENNYVKLNPKDLGQVYRSFKAQYEEMILDASQKDVPAKTVFEEIEKNQLWLEAHGCKRVSGFKLRSIYTKIEAFKIKWASGEKLELKRKPHKNIGTVYNKHLQNAKFRDLILPELCNFYVTNGTYESKDRVSSARYAVDLLIKYAQETLENGDDSFVEMLVPSVRQAAYRWFLKQVNRLSLKQIALIANHAGKWRNQYAVMNKGAFTDDINFNDYWAMDDHEIHLSGGLEWDESLKEMKLQTLKMWTLIEMFTMKPLAYVIRTGDLTAEDVSNVLIQAFQKYGLPNKAILYDNGSVTTADTVENLVLNVIRHPGLRHLQGTVMNDPAPCAPYTPTAKSNVELFHSILERETSPFVQNYIAGKRENGRHTGFKLSPEECVNTVEELKNLYIKYLSETGMYQTRLRDRQIKQKGITISINQHWANCTRDWKFTGIGDDVLHAAYCDTRLVTYSNQVKFKVNKCDQVFVPIDYMSYIYNDKQFMAKNIPGKYNRIYLYTVQRITGLDVHTGEEIRHEAGELVAVLHNLNFMTSEKRRALVSKLNKQKRKASKEAEKFIKMKANIENPVLTSMQVDANDTVVNGQKIVEKEARKIIDGNLEDIAKQVYVKASDVIAKPATVVMTDEDVMKILADEQ